MGDLPGRDPGVRRADDDPSAVPRLEFIVFRDATGQWRWRLNAANHRIIATSGEGYHNQADCLWAVDLVRRGAAAAGFDDLSRYGRESRGESQKTEREGGRGKAERAARQRTPSPSPVPRPLSPPPHIRAAIGHCLQAAADLRGREEVIEFFRAMVGRIFDHHVYLPIGGDVLRQKCQDEAADEITELLNAQ